MTRITRNAMVRCSTAAALLLALSVLGAPARAAIIDNLVGYWTFDGSFNDSSASDNNGVKFGSPSFVAGKVGQALSVTGATGYVRSLNNVWLSGNQPRTLNLWFNAASTANAAPVSTGATGNGQLFDLYLNSSALYGGHFYGGSWDTFGGAANPTYAANTWTMATLVYSGGNTVDVYKDGQFVKTATLPGNLNTTNSRLSVGAGGAYGPVYTGLVDEVALWNRTLSASEISSLYNGGQGRNLIPASPLALQFHANAGAGPIPAPGTIGPGHAVSVVKGGAWNAISSHFTGTVQDENGNNLPNPVTIEFAGYGAGVNDFGPLTNWGTATLSPFNAALTGWGGVYDTALTRDSLYVSAGGRNVMGTRVSGLPAGTYDIFFVRGNASPAMQVAIGANITELAGNSFNTPSFQGSTTNNTWIEGTSLQAGNYFRKRVTISGPGDNIAVITDVVGVNYNDFLGLQIAKVADPTPPTLFRTQFDAGRSVGATYGPAGPGHAVGLFTGNEWNALGASPTGSYTGQFVDEHGNPLRTDGGAPLTLTVQMAANNGLSPLSNWGSVTVADWAGNPGNTGVNNTDLMRDALYVSAGSREVMGIRVGGLPAGWYEVLMMPKYAASTSPQSVSIGANINALDGSLVSPAGAFDTWVEGTSTQAGNYYRKRVNIAGPADWIAMIYDNTSYTSTEFMGFQIARIAVPEPSAWALLALGLAAVAVPAWRRKRR